jgi:hypothetical protein
MPKMRATITVEYELADFDTPEDRAAVLADDLEYATDDPIGFLTDGPFGVVDVSITEVSA